MFAGVGGFRLGLEGYDDPRHPEFHCAAAGPFKTVWANQWEPQGSPARQFAWRCYEQRFGEGSCINEDITKVLDAYEYGDVDIPDIDMVVGGFPCQDYSVAKPLSLAGGIEGKKGVLWWQIRRLLDMKKPKYLLLENVDRLLKSPASQRGRDFAIILSCLAALGYSVEWRVINAADYGMPQRRRRVYLYGVRTDQAWDFEKRLFESGVMARAFPVKQMADPNNSRLDIRIGGGLTSVSLDPYEVSNEFGKKAKTSFFQNAGVMQHGEVYTRKVEPTFHGVHATLADIRVPDSEVPEQYFIDSEKLPQWQYLKGAKREERTSANGYAYTYSEGAMAFPDALDKPARTILTGEGGAGASRTKHVIKAEDGRLRRLVPDELDQIQMFPKGWTNTGMTDGHRAFCMGNALVVGIPHAIGKVIAEDRAAGRE
ncbi:DNA (cytosine-5-)-methyltransferase [Bifidobacterium primatium]|uniref:Cytosine-specific methyltransferase n=2 Tax=Bifidobacterium primatium TaxID=2045438 RepID=A0A2M9HBZ7_9BIFI|nr:DNA (cytosine-5-)-methyltransferase [Bifidobacterium primatium]